MATLTTTTFPDQDSFTDEPMQLLRGRPSAPGYNVWTFNEHQRFREAMRLFPHGPWRRVAAYVGTRTVRQTVSHHRKCEERHRRHRLGLKTPGRKRTRGQRRDTGFTSDSGSSSDSGSGSDDWEDFISEILPPVEEMDGLRDSLESLDIDELQEFVDESLPSSEELRNVLDLLDSLEIVEANDAIKDSN